MPLHPAELALGSQEPGHTPTPTHVAVTPPRHTGHHPSGHAQRTLDRYSEAASQRQTQRLVMRRIQKIRLLLTSVAFATMVIGLSDLAFLIGYYAYMRFAQLSAMRTHWTPDDDPECMATAGFIGLALALGIATSLRKTCGWKRRAEPGLRGRWYKFWPVG